MTTWEYKIIDSRDIQGSGRVLGGGLEIEAGHGGGTAVSLQLPARQS